SAREDRAPRVVPALTVDRRVRLHDARLASDPAPPVRPSHWGCTVSSWPVHLLVLPHAALALLVGAYWVYLGSRSAVEESRVPVGVALRAVLSAGTIISSAVSVIAAARIDHHGMTGFLGLFYVDALSKFGAFVVAVPSLFASIASHAYVRATLGDLAWRRALP